MYLQVLPLFFQFRAVLFMVVPEVLRFFHEFQEMQFAGVAAFVGRGVVGVSHSSSVRSRSCDVAAEPQ